uniref:Uncharacterized protein n=1 Tax=Escherichia coli TaxID=562 RepID=A0A890DEY5_ECOLX|nr:hypothetical protein [Escherichia coli]
MNAATEARSQATGMNIQHPIDQENSPAPDIVMDKYLSRTVLRSTPHFFSMSRSLVTCFSSFWIWRA